MSFDPERLHVIRCYERLPPLPGGMERHIAELTAAQRVLGVRVTELFNRGDPAGESIQVWRGRSLDQVRPYLFRAALFYSAAALRRFDFSDARFRVVHIHGDWPAFLFGSMFGRFIGAHAIAASLHATFHAPIGRYQWALRGCEPIFTTGTLQARELSNALNRPAWHLPSAPAELFFEEPASTHRAIDVVAVGSLVPVKNMDLLLECAGRRPNLTFAIVGTGPDAGALRRRAQKLSLHNVSFLGAITIEEVRSVLQTARVFMNTSLTEGSPTAVLEAMACGLPVILTPSNDYSDIIDQGVNGYVTSGWDADELINALELFLQRPDRLEKAGKAARSTAASHRWPLKARLVTDLMLAAADRTKAERQCSRP
jgi:glycosyltransferase involved in cell wall biosynthesis